MAFPESRERTPHIVYIIILILPFLLLYWMLPFIATQSIGQDYQTIGIQSQMELFFSIKTGSFPLYVPGFAFGTSSSTLTLGQVYHPISHIASIMPGYWDGKALQCNTFLRLLTLGLTQLALFSFLRKLKINILFSFLLSLITVYNLRMLDLFRYGASLEAYTGHLLLCVSIGCYYINQTSRERLVPRWFNPLTIIALTYWLVCSGHAQMMYYGLLGTGLFTLVAPFFISEMLAERHTDIKSAFRFWIKVGSFLSLGILLSSAYIFPFYFDFIATNAGRVGQSYDWSIAYGDTFIGTLNSFFLPFRSDVHGNFGGSSLFIVALIFPILRLFRVKIPVSIWIIWAILLLSFLYMQGDRTPIHRLAWEYLPFASSFRTAGRISLIIPVFIMMLLAWVVQSASFTFNLKDRSVTLTPVTVVSSTALLVMAVYLITIALSILFKVNGMTEFAHFIPVNIREIPRFIELLVMFSGIVSLFLFALCGAFQKRSGMLGVILCVVTLLQTGSILKYGTWITERHDNPTFEKMLSQKKETLDYRYHPGSGLYSSIIDTQVRRSFAEPVLAKIYFDVIPVDDQESAYSIMRQNRLPHQIFIEDYDYRTEENAGARKNSITSKIGRVELVYSSFNRIKFKVISDEKAFLGLSYPYTGHWNAWVNGDKVRVYRANGAAQAVQIPEGESSVEFRYWSPAAFWGMLISCLAFILIGLFFCSQINNGVVRLFSILLVLSVGVGGFLSWYDSLYKGNNLETRYSWEYSEPPLIPNLAYGKKTWTSSSLAGGFELLNYSSRAVDGNLSPGSGFSTSSQDNPFLVIDLHRPDKIQSVLLYESVNDRESNTRPINIAVSIDGHQWRTSASVTSEKNNAGPIRVLLESTPTARYIRIKATGYCRLTLDEVDVYGPEND
jgi:hypothetical protein